MPFYEYQCSSCQHHTEVLQKISDAPLRKCPDCGKPALKRLISAPVFRLKGGGWYETDFKSDQEKKRNLHGADEAGESKSDGKSDGKSDTAKETPKPAEGKGESKAEAKPAEAKAESGTAKTSSAKTTSAKPKPAARPVKAKASAAKKKKR